MQEVHLHSGNIWIHGRLTWWLESEHGRVLGVGGGGMFFKHLVNVTKPVPVADSVKQMLKWKLNV